MSLYINTNKGMAYQVMKDFTVAYDKDYYGKLVSKGATETAKLMNKSRCELVEAYLGKYNRDDEDTHYKILDIGCGLGTFMSMYDSPFTYGYEINPYLIDNLISSNKFYNPYTSKLDCFKAICFWDSLEHMQEPKTILNKIKEDTYVFVSIPIIEDLLKVQQSKHYRPNEHYYYFTSQGFSHYMKEVGFNLIEISDAEIKAGREDIYQFVFRRK